mmetsp:Transcript_7185/g.14171  ORF Transcript_7185/g.14171 Transcript_7185/m.14171 type:complete len:99 (-) Transcript_7185:549-845(-)
MTFAIKPFPASTFSPLDFFIVLLRKNARRPANLCVVTLTTEWVPATPLKRYCPKSSTSSSLAQTHLFSPHRLMILAEDKKGSPVTLVCCSACQEMPSS